MANWDKADVYTLEAIKHFLKVRTDLAPVKFLSGNFAASNEKLYYAYFEDTKLTKWYKSIGSNREGVFRVIVNEDLLKPETIDIDLFARIPSSLEGENRFILRIAYTILVAWQRCFIEAYKIAEKDHNKITYNNAKEWYEGLK